MTAFFTALAKALNDTRAMNHRTYCEIGRANAEVLAAAQGAKDGDNCLFFIGNGGSAAIASHMAVDWEKNGKYRARCFNDAASLTCLGNDFGYHAVFAHPLKRHAKKNDVLFAVSSSGESLSILNAVQAARSREAIIVTFSGFDNANPLRLLGDLNFYVPSYDYGVVECAHLALIHGILNEAMEVRSAA